MVTDTSQQTWDVAVTEFCGPTTPLSATVPRAVARSKHCDVQDLPVVGVETDLEAVEQYAAQVSAAATTWLCDVGAPARLPNQMTSACWEAHLGTKCAPTPVMQFPYADVMVAIWLPDAVTVYVPADDASTDET